jgi:hypothetical protein
MREIEEFRTNQDFLSILSKIQVLEAIQKAFDDVKYLKTF